MAYIICMKKYINTYKYIYIYNDPEVDRLWYGFNPTTEKNKD